MWERLCRMALVLGVLLVSLEGRASGLGQSEDGPSMDEMSKRATSYVDEIKKAREFAESALRKARQDKDATRIDCVNQALLALKGYQRIAEDYELQLRADYKQGNDTNVRQSYAKVEFARSKVKELDARVKSCGGPPDDSMFDDQPSVDTTADTDLPNMDPLKVLEQSDVFISRPSTPSPYE